MEIRFTSLKLVIGTALLIPALVACAQFQQPDNNDPVLNAVMETPAPVEQEFSVRSLSSGVLLPKTSNEVDD